MVGLLRQGGGSSEAAVLKEPFCNSFVSSDLEAYLGNIVHSSDQSPRRSQYIEHGSYYVCLMRGEDGNELAVEGSSAARSVASFYDYYHLVDGDKFCEDCIVQKDDVSGAVLIGKYNDYQIRAAWIKGNTAVELKLFRPYASEDQPRVASELMRLASLRSPQLLASRGQLLVETPAASTSNR